MPDDRQIWQRIRHGDTHAFDEFYRQNSERLEVFLRRMVGNRQVAEDLMQETFTQVWCRPNGFQPERGACGLTFSASGESARRNGGERIVRLITTNQMSMPHPRSSAAQNPLRSLRTRLADFQKNNEHCCGCVKLKGNPTLTWPRFSVFPWVR